MAPYESDTENKAKTISLLNGNTTLISVALLQFESTKTMCTQSVHVYTQRPIETRQVYTLWILSDRDYDVVRTKDKISKHCIPVIRSYF